MTEERPLIVATDEVVLDEVLRLAAAVGCVPERLPDLAAARARWLHAPLVIVDEEAARAQVSLPRRPGVLLVCKGAPAPPTWELAFSAGVDRIVSLPEEESELIAALADVAEGPGTPGGRVVAVIGGCGGAGASVLAASVGLTASRAGGRALLVDCDPLGGGVDLLFGAELTVGSRWPELTVDSGRVSMAALQEALPECGDSGGRLSFVSCDRDGPGPSGAAIAAVIEAGRRAGRTVVCDLPRHLTGAALSAVDRADLVVVVVPAALRACFAARQVVQRVDARARQVLVLVRWPSPSELSPSDVANLVGLRLLASMGPERGLGKELERGVFSPKPKGPLATASGAVLAAVHADRLRESA
jgi:secretion/DNA translocation related CpaE-like protein